MKQGKEFYAPRGASQLTIDTGGLQPGFYGLVLLRAGGARQAGKFVVARP